MAAQENPLINLMNGAGLTYDGFRAVGGALTPEQLGIALLFAVETRNPHYALIFKWNGVDVNYQHGSEYNGRTPIHCAVVNDDNDMAKELLSFVNVDLTLPDNDGENVLQYAKKHKKILFIEVLQAKGPQYKGLLEEYELGDSKLFPSMPILKY